MTPIPVIFDTIIYFFRHGYSHRRYNLKIRKLFQVIKIGSLTSLKNIFM